MMKILLLLLSIFVLSSCTMQRHTAAIASQDSMVKSAWHPEMRAEGMPLPETSTAQASACSAAQEERQALSLIRKTLRQKSAALRPAKEPALLYRQTFTPRMPGITQESTSSATRRPPDIPAITSFGLAMVSLLCLLSIGLAWQLLFAACGLGLAAFITGVVAVCRRRRGHSGLGFAVAGIILGGLVFLLSIALIIFIVAFLLLWGGNVAVSFH